MLIANYGDDPLQLLQFLHDDCGFHIYCLDEERYGDAMHVTDLREFTNQLYQSNGMLDLVLLHGSMGDAAYGQNIFTIWPALLNAVLGSK